MNIPRFTVTILLLVTACGKTRAMPNETNGDPVASPSASPVANGPAIPSGPVVQPGPSRIDALGCPLEITLVPDTTTPIVGQPVYVTLRATTTCAKKLHVLDGGDYRNQFGRADSFTVTMTDASGKGIKPLDAGPGFGGMIGPQPLAKDQPFDKRLLLGHWFDPQPPGRYTITVSKKLHIGEASTPDEKDKVQIPVSASAIVDFRAGTPAELGALIDATGERALSEGDASDEAIRVLTSFKDERTVPWFVKLISGKRESQRIYGVWGLRPYGTDEAVNALEKALGEKDLAISAAQTLAENPHPRAWDVLWANRAHKDDNVRLTALHALAKKKGLPDKKQRLQGFVNDPAPVVRQEAQRYLKELPDAK